MFVATLGEIYDPTTMGPPPATGQAEIDTKLSAAFKQLHAINVSMVTERNRGNSAGVAALLPMYEKWLNEYKYWSQKAGEHDFTVFDQFLLSMQNYATGAVKGIAKAVAPLIIGAVVVHALITRRR